jgi:hypothetical protein
MRADAAKELVMLSYINYECELRYEWLEVVSGGTRNQHAVVALHAMYDTVHRDHVNRYTHTYCSIRTARPPKSTEFCISGLVQVECTEAL